MLEGGSLRATTTSGPNWPGSGNLGPRWTGSPLTLTLRRLRPLASTRATGKATARRTNSPIKGPNSTARGWSRPLSGRKPWPWPQGSRASSGPFCRRSSEWSRGCGGRGLPGRNLVPRGPTAGKGQRRTPPQGRTCWCPRALGLGAPGATAGWRPPGPPGNGGRSPAWFGNGRPSWMSRHLAMTFGPRPLGSDATAAGGTCSAGTEPGCSGRSVRGLRALGEGGR